MQEMSTLIVRDERFLDHDPGPGHPESPERLRAIYNALDRSRYKDLFQVIPPRAATRQELAWNHSPDYIERISRTEGLSRYQLDPDTSTSSGSWLAARLAVGGIFSAMERIWAGDNDNGFALVRPPGHHAERDHAMGFCLFNNVALGAHFARKVLGAQRVMIVDWDLHHGNGTQHSFYSDPTVLYFSTHQYPYYPGTGAINEIGQGAGRGFTVNVPLSPGCGDYDFAAIYNTLLIPLCRAYDPDFLLVSAGFDIYTDDPLGGMNVTVNGFAYLARILLGLARQCCNGNILFCLEGGYNLDGLRDGVLSVLLECKGRGAVGGEQLKELDNNIEGPEVIQEVKSVLSDYWDL